MMINSIILRITLPLFQILLTRPSDAEKKPSEEFVFQIKSTLEEEEVSLRCAEKYLILSI